MMELMHSIAWVVAIPAAAILIAIITGLLSFIFGFLLSMWDEK